MGGKGAKRINSRIKRMTLMTEIWVDGPCRPVKWPTVFTAKNSMKASGF